MHVRASVCLGVRACVRVSQSQSVGEFIYLPACQTADAAMQQAARTRVRVPSSGQLSFHLPMLACLPPCLPNSQSVSQLGSLAALFSSTVCLHAGKLESFLFFAICTAVSLSRSA